MKDVAEKSKLHPKAVDFFRRKDSKRLHGLFWGGGSGETSPPQLIKLTVAASQSQSRLNIAFLQTDVWRK